MLAEKLVTIVARGETITRDWTSPTSSCSPVTTTSTLPACQSILSSDYTEAIRQVAVFGDPVITGSVTSGRWDHLIAQWRV